MLNKAILDLRITQFYHFEYNEHTLDVVYLMRQLLFDQIVDFLTGAIRNSSTNKGLVDLGDAIHGIIVVKTLYYLQLSVIVHLSQHFPKEKIVLRTVFGMNQLSEKLKIVSLAS